MIEIVKDANEVFEYTVMWVWLACIPAGILAFLLGLRSVAEAILCLFMFVSVFGIFPLALKYGLDDSFYSEFMSRTEVDIKKGFLLGSIGIIITISLFIVIFVIGGIVK